MPRFEILVADALILGALAWASLPFIAAFLAAAWALLAPFLLVLLAVLLVGLLAAAFAYRP